MKEKEAQNLLKNRELQDREIKKLASENDSQSDYLRQLEKLKVKELEDQRVKLENQNNFVIDQIKVSHQTQAHIMNTEVKDLKHQCNLKASEVGEMINKYDRLESALSEF